MLTRRRFLTLGGAALASAAGTGIYTWQIEPHRIEVVRVPMPLRDLPAEHAGRTLLQLSDLHVGAQVDSAYLAHAFRRAAALQPDFVAITGDFVSYRSAAEYRELARVLRALPRGRAGTFAVLGNHDYGRGWRQVPVANSVAQVIEDAGAVVLRNGHRTVDGIQFAGLADYWSPDFDALRPVGDLLSAPPRPEGSNELAPAASAIAALGRRTPTVVLCHNPDVVDEPVWGDLEAWVLAGHTHGGQCKPPFLPPPALPVRNRRYTAGVFDVGPGRRLYINRGLGHLLKVRFNVRPEITLFTFESA